MKPVLHFKDVEAGVPGVTPCRIRDLRIEIGECCVLYGLNPGAQDLLIRLATGARAPDHGAVSMLGTNAADCDDTLWFQLVTKIAVVDPATPLPQMDSVGKYLASAILAMEPSMGEPHLSRNVLRVSGRVKLTIAELSAGLADAAPDLQWKARLAGALVRNPGVLMIRVQDTQGHDALPRLLRRARRGGRLSIVAFVSDETLAAEIADRVLFLNPETGGFIEKRLRGWYHNVFSFIGISPASRRELAATIAEYKSKNTRRV